ncbi:hypothetical protein HY857_00415 [Candidatus Saccharibacteria bacterium]|nr:hypothetical protein [Candidatus Saccharibacteria bacterium]
MDDNEALNLSAAEKQAKEILIKADDITRRAADVLAGKSGSDPMEVFPVTKVVRSENEYPELNDNQVEALTAIAREIGFGREADVMLSELGLQGAHVVIEGGQPHKIVAEARMVMEDTAARPKTIIFSGSQADHRKITSDTERASARRQFNDEVPETEYDVARKVAESLPGFVAHQEDKALPFGYNIHNNQEFLQEPTGQFVEIGTVGDTAVVLMRIDSETYVDEKTGKSKHRKQPSTYDVMRIVSRASSLLGKEDDPIGFVTSSSYSLSRQVDAARASVVGNPVGVATYGTTRLAGVNGTDVPTSVDLRQLPSELHTIARRSRDLRSLLQKELIIK